MQLKETKSKDKIILEFLFDKAGWEAEIDGAYAATAGKYSVQGFRKGKAPRGVIEKNYGSDIFAEEALKNAFTREYNKFINANSEVKPIDYPTVKEFTEANDGGMKIVAEILIEPEFTLGKYTGFEAKQKTKAVTDKDIDNYLQESAKARMRQVAAEKNHKIKNGDIAVIDFTGSVDGVEFEGGKGEKYELEIGSKSFIDSFEEQLVGLTIGDKKDVFVKFPKEYHAPNLAGADAKFEVKINNVLVKQFPEINDQFAKESSEFENLLEWKKQIKENLAQAEVNKAKSDAEFELLKQVTDATKIDIPERMVEIQLEYILNDINRRLSMQGLNIEMYAQYTGTTIEKMREEQRENAYRSVKARLVFDAIAQKEKISVSVEKLEEEIVRGSGGDKKREQEIRKNREMMGMVEQNLLFDKVLEFLKQNNNIS